MSTPAAVPTTHRQDMPIFQHHVSQTCVLSVLISALCLCPVFINCDTISTSSDIIYAAHPHHPWVPHGLTANRCSAVSAFCSLNWVSYDSFDTHRNWRVTLALLANPPSLGEEMVTEPLQRPHWLSFQEGTLMHWGDDERATRIKWIFVKYLPLIEGALPGLTSERVRDWL